MIIDLNPNGRTHPYDYFEEDEDAAPENPYLDEAEEQNQIEAMESIRACPSQFVEFAIYMPIKGGLKPFSFKGRKYLRPIYDSPAKRKLLMAGRQVEKTFNINTLVSLSNGSLVPAGLIEVGDFVAAMDSANNSHVSTGKVSWVSKRYYKPCVLITTRQGHFIEVAKTHPMRLWERWTEAGELSVGDRLAVVRKCGEFGDLETIPERVRLTAYLLGDGHIGSYIDFTSNPGEKLEEFKEDLDTIQCHYSIYPKSDSSSLCVKPDMVSDLEDWLDEDSLMGTLSATKFIPEWVFELSRQQTAMFLSRLWSCDGHVKQNSRSKYSLEYCSISERLVTQTQALLWKFGIPSKIRHFIPELYVGKVDENGVQKVGYICRVETQEGVRRFLTEIQALEKNAPLPTSKENNNRDTYPKEVNELIRKILESREGNQRTAKWRSRFYNSGLRRTLKYPPTKGKLASYVEFFKNEGEFDEELVSQLEAHLDTDLYWDKIVSIEDIGEQECIDFTVEEHNNFVANGFITHNSTYLGNTILAYAAINPFFRTLYVSPSNTQTKVFSRDRIKEPMEISPVLRHFSNSKLLANVLEKKFVNQSQITLRFAFLNADRCRGIAADYVNVDEFQDILLENVPVIEECASHSEHKLFTYSGTPKSLDNAIEHYWSRFSTQNEWGVPCKHHGTPKNPSSWHWNVLAEDNIGDKSLICDKCGEQIFPADEDSRWISLNPNPNVEKPFEGYRLPQLMVPWIDFSDIKDKQRKYSRAKFHNEVLGRSYDSGTRPLTRADMKKNSWDELSMSYYRDVIKWSQQYPIFMGLDWGCHDDQTRILTQERGFVHFKDLTDEDQVAQFDPDTRKMTFVKPLVHTVKSWNKPLLHFKTKNVDMMLTHTHRVLYRVNGPRFKVNTAEEVTQFSRIRLVGHVDWRGEEKNTFSLPGLPSSPGYPGCDPLSVPMDTWLEFLGYYLSEGGLCFNTSKKGNKLPSCLKFSQRIIKDKGIARKKESLVRIKKIRACLKSIGLNLSEFPNPKTGDFNWTMYGKQIWHWVEKNVGSYCDTKRIPREFLNLSKRQLQILFDSMMLGDGNTDKRKRNFNGCYGSTSKRLCEDFMEICIRLGLRTSVRLSKPAEGNRKGRYVTCWSGGREHCMNHPGEIERIPYKGKVYCCKVPTGFIVTERNGKVAFQGNTGEGSYTVMTLGGYLPFAPEKFTYFYMKRFDGIESEPKIQLEVIRAHIRDFNVRFIGVDYGGGFWPNDELVRHFGAEKIKKYQWVGQIKKKMVFEPRLGIPRYLCHRTEVMSDIFNAIKRGNVFRYPRWEEFEDPYAADFLNIFSEYNERTRMNVYKHAPSHPDDTFHSSVFCFLASYFFKVRPDVILPQKEVDRDHYDPNEELDII